MLFVFDSCTGGPLFREVDREVAKAEDVAKVCEGEPIPDRAPYERGRATEAATIGLDGRSPLPYSLGGPASSSPTTAPADIDLALDTTTVAICVSAAEVIDEQDCSGYPLILSARIESRLVEVRTAKVLDTQEFVAGYTECPLMIPLSRSGAQLSDYDSQLTQDAEERAQVRAVAYHEGG